MNYAILFFSAFIGGISVFFFPKGNHSNLKILLAFSGSYLFAITVLHLIPEVYSKTGRYTGIYILVGFALQILLEQFSKGIEHGHIHLPSGTKKGLLPWGLLISLSLHAFLEGIPIAGYQKNPLLFGIAIHHIPASFALGSIFLLSEIDKKKTILWISIFACMSPLGLLLGNSVSNVAYDLNFFMAIVIGMFLHISTTILFESSVDHKFNFKKGIAIIIGSGIALLNFIF